jgi:phosphopantetheinyl transferase
MYESNILVVTVPVLEIEPQELPLHLQVLLSRGDFLHANGIHENFKKFEFISGRALLRGVLSVLLDCSSDDLILLLERNGRPYVNNAGLDFSLTHAGGYVCIAVSRHCRVGVDIEAVESIESCDILDEFIRNKFQKNSNVSIDVSTNMASYWCMCEAYAKCSGTDLLASMLSKQFGALLEQKPLENWFVGQDYSIFLTSVAQERLAVAVCVDSNPGPLTFLNVDLFDQCFLAGLHAQMR